jgi:hypothetical protein
VSRGPGSWAESELWKRQDTGAVIQVGGGGRDLAKGSVVRPAAVDTECAAPSTTRETRTIQGIRRDSHGDVTRGGFAVDETMPGFVSLVGDPHDLVLVLGITGEGDLVLGLAVGGPVDPGRVRMRWMQYRRRTRDLPLSLHVHPCPSSSIHTQPSTPSPQIRSSHLGARTTGSGV